MLEAGCGVGAQTVILARNSPGARFTCVDLSAESLRQAEARVRGAGLDNASLRRAIQCLVELQARACGDALIGRRLFPLLSGAGLSSVAVSPRMVYVDGSRPEQGEGFTRDTFTAMVEGVRERALALGLVEPCAWAQGIDELRRTAEPDGVFCYTFFKAVGVR